MKSEDDFLKELLSMFKVEAEEHLKTISSGLVDLEKARGKDRLYILEEVYREAHSLKGAARAVNLIKVEQLCQSLESIFALLKSGKLEGTKEDFDVMLDAVDIVSEAVDSPDTTNISDIQKSLRRIEKAWSDADAKKSGASAGVKPKKARSTQKKKAAGAVSKTKKAAVAPEQHPAESEKAPKHGGEKQPEKTAAPKRQAKQNYEIKPVFSETIRIPTSRLDSILLQIEEMVSAKLVTGQVTEDLSEMLVNLDIWRKEWEKVYANVKESGIKKSPDTAGLGADQEFFNWNFHQLKDVDDKLTFIYKMAEDNYRQLSVMIDNLLEDMKTLMMLPFSTLLKMIPKVVRDIARDQDKEVELVMRGSTTEVDRRILEEIKDPLVHLLRNCIDHGVERPDVREKAGKPRQGTVTITISQIEGNKIEILVQDDGGGIDPEKVRRAAVQKKIISPQAAKSLSDDQSIALVFESDLSTSPIITDISGRGLGLAIVREKVENLGGMIYLDTETGQGTTFRIVIPVTLATFRGTLIQTGGRSFVIPTAHVERAMRIPLADIKTVENRQIVTVDSQVISLVHLSDILGMRNQKEAKEHSESLQFVIVRSSSKLIAVGVDEVINEQEFLVKGLGKHIQRVLNISGATILGSGKVVPIINVQDIVKTAERVSYAPVQEVSMEKKQDERKSILIAEDSITSRTLIKNILESAGYDVKATVDGADAFSALRGGSYDLVVSDVEMPRMNGFELVTNIRKNKSTAALPVILVTGLETKEDRERGIEVGANAYIVKRSFDQSNLLEVIGKLI